MEIIIYFLGIFSALFSFILSFPFYENSYFLLGSCLVMILIQFVIYKVIENKKLFYIISISISLICLVLSLSGLLYIKDVILNKYMEESIYTFEIMGKYNYYHQFLNVLITMLSIVLPFHTLYIFVFEKKKYILSIFVLFPFVFVEILFTITPPLYGMPYILYCMTAILSHRQHKIQMMPIVLSICFMLSLFYIVSPTTYVHPRQKQEHQSVVELSVPGYNNQSYDLMKQGNRHYMNRIELRVDGITHQSFLLKEMVYDYFDGQWQQTTSSYEKSYMYLKNIQALSQMFECELKKIRVVDIYHQNLVYVPYFYYSSSDTLKYFDSHFEGNKEEEFEMIIPNQQWNHYLSSSDENKYHLLYDNIDFSVHSLNNEINDYIPDDTRQVLDEFMKQHQLYEYKSCQDLIAKAKKAISNETKYSLTPGVTPENEDFFDYFLNKNKKGYCVHYASTLALILKMCGFHAHFVTGYQVDGNHSFEDYTVIYDSSSHAWVEVEDPILGFIPIEATPASSDSTVGNRNHTTSQTSDDQINHQTQQQTIVNQDNTEVHFEIPRYIYTICIVIFLIFLIYLQSRIRLKRRWQRLNKNQRVCQMYYHFQQLNMNIDKNMIDLCKKAKFSSHQLTDEEYQKILSYYWYVLKKIYQNTSIFYKIKLKIIYAYI